MLTHRELHKTSNFNDHKDLFIPKMTALFVEGLALDQCEQKPSKKLLHKEIRSDESLKIVCLDLPSTHLKAKDVAVNLGLSQVINLRKKDSHTDTEDDQYKAVGEFIRGLSHCFNNLLMGIWGNASLIALSIDQAHPISERVAQMERLIQNGSNLIHIIFGYLAERRMVAKRLQLVQLIHEINACIQSHGGHMDIEKIETSMQWASRVQCPSLIAGNIARVLEQLFDWVEDHYQGILREDTGNKAIAERLASIDGMLQKGFKMTKQLKLYAGEIIPNRRRVNLKSLLQNHAKQTRQNHKHIAIRCFLAKNLSPIRADRSQLSFVFEQLIDNAVQSMPGEGKLTVKVRPLIEEAAHERCVVHTGRDYLVVTIADTGKGMDIRSQARIFEPFYTGEPNQSRLGLGLASATGIVKAHGGYIQVRSISGTGTTIKVYLPIA